jgi:hypothetical protein
MLTQRILAALKPVWAALQDERGVFDMTNVRKASPAGVFFPSLRLADQLADIAAQDMGVAGLKHLKGRIVAKSGIANAETFSFVIRVDTVVGMSSPELIFQSPTYTAVTGDVKACIDFDCFSEEGFQFVNVDVTNAGNWTFDLLLEAAP